MKKKGFTLIELLAVIVILAIIALIATPMVLNTIDDARKGAAESSAYSYIEEVETEVAKYMLDNNGVRYSAGKYDISTLRTDLKVEVKGDAPSAGNICIGSNGTVTKASLKINNYVVNYDGKETTTTDLDEVEDITCDGTSGEVVFVPTYFAFGTPDTSSITDYTTLDKNVFATLYSDNSTGVCINDGELFCLQANDYDNAVTALKAHFGESNCTDYEYGVRCNSSDFLVGTYSNGNVDCRDNLTNAYCNAYADGAFLCTEE